jgi:hypothetical protein
VNDSQQRVCHTGVGYSMDCNRTCGCGGVLSENNVWRAFDCEPVSVCVSVRKVRARAL